MKIAISCEKCRSKHVSIEKEEGCLAIVTCLDCGNIQIADIED